MNVTRRGFLAGLAAIAVVHQLPKQLAAPKKTYSFKDVSGTVNAYQAYGINDNSSAMYTKLYELDPHVFMTIDLRGMTINITTRADRSQVTEILWQYKPIGVLAIINGTQADFSEHWKRFV